MQMDVDHVPSTAAAEGSDHPLEKAEVLARVADAIGDGLEAGGEILRAEYPFAPPVKNSRNYTERQCLRVFYRDGFLDRYSGTRLVHPGALRTLAILLPEDFPFHTNWQMSRTHSAFWELCPTIDHQVLVARGGEDVESNWVSTSMLRNSAKAHWTLEELGWSLYPSGDHIQWDGLSGWFVDYLTGHPELMAEQYLATWFRATVEVRAGLA
ncbi:HNH endonuclease [Rhodococcus zopfii]|uniref:HNH endonuclease n=1 Tax=Rhodococcus zopfii TaxID=43772 RepID=UPI000AE5CC35|nr:HNH endonuclease [Rhodococcus zopfii]